MEGKKSVDYISVLSVLSAFAVVSLHTNGCFWEFSKERYWLTANIIESVYYFAVPVFFMISGATLMDYPKRYTNKVYAKKRIFRTVLPFLVWSIIGWLIHVIHHLVCGIPIASEYLSLSGVWNDVIGTSFVPIYWFFIPLFMCYLCIPLFASIREEKRKPLFLYLVICAFVVNSLIPFCISIFSLSYKWPFHFEVAGGYLIYILLGYLLNRLIIDHKVRIVIYILAIGGLVLHIVGTYIMSMAAGKIIQVYKGYLNVPCLLYSIGIFIFFKMNYDKIMRKIGGAIQFLKNYTFAVYLLHYFVMTYLIKVTHWDTHSIIYRLLGPVLIWSICIGITYVIRKLPYGRKILP